MMTTLYMIAWGLLAVAQMKGMYTWHLATLLADLRLRDRHVQARGRRRAALRAWRVVCWGR